MAGAAPRVDGGFVGSVVDYGRRLCLLRACWRCFRPSRYSFRFTACFRSDRASSISSRVLARCLPPAAYDLVAQRIHALAVKAATTLSWGVVLGVVLALWSASAGTKALIVCAQCRLRGAGEARPYPLQSHRIVVHPVRRVRRGIALLCHRRPADGAAAGAGSGRSARWPPVRVLPVAAGLRRAGLVPALSLRTVTARGALALGDPGLGGWRPCSGCWPRSCSRSMSPTSPPTMRPMARWVPSSSLLFWFYISAFVVMLGAELNAELELQTKRDTTAGPERPMGSAGRLRRRSRRHPRLTLRHPAAPALGLAPRRAIAHLHSRAGFRRAAAGGRGGIGRHAGFRFLWREPCEFESRRPHQASTRSTDTDAADPELGGRPIEARAMQVTADCGRGAEAGIQGHGPGRRDREPGADPAGAAGEDRAAARLPARQGAAAPAQEAVWPLDPGRGAGGGGRRGLQEDHRRQPAPAGAAAEDRGHLVRRGQGSRVRASSSRCCRRCPRSSLAPSA